MSWLGPLSRHLHGNGRGRKAPPGLIAPSAEFLDSVIENIPNMLFIKDAKTLRFVRINRAGEDLLGVSREDLLGKNDYDFFTPDQADFFTQKDRAVLAGREMVDIPEEPISTKYGVRILHTKKIPWLDQSGQPLFLIGISEDITDRKKAEQQQIALLREQMARSEAEKMNQRLSLLSEASQVLNISLNIDKTMQDFAQLITSAIADWCLIDILEENREQTRLTVAHHSERLADEAMAWRSRYPLNLTSPHGVAGVIQSGHPEIYPKLGVDPSRVEFIESDLEFLRTHAPGATMIVPLRLGDRVIGAMTLVSSTPDSYGDLDLSIARDLASRAAFAIENARLYREAQEANRAKTAFLANMSHEVRTPLAAVLGFARIVHDDPSLPAEHRKNMELITRNGQQLLRIVDEILDISKVESDRMDLEFLVFNLKDLISEIVSLLTVKAEEKAIKLSVEFLGEVPDGIRSDPTRLRQTLINVIGNAIKFTSQGSVLLQVQMIPSIIESGAGRILFRVIDTGIGLSSEQAQALFQPFAQADTSTTRRFGGTGLGLFLSRRLARMLGGDLILEKSEPGKGSVFTLAIETREIRDVMEKPAPPPAPEPTTAPKMVTQQGHILVVDDSEDNRFLVEWYLKKLGFTCETAANGAEGLQKATAGVFRTVLLDIQMPEMDGFQVVKALREKQYAGHVVALTAHAMKGDRERCLEAGFDDYLTKPLDEKTLRRLLLELH